MNSLRWIMRALLLIIVMGLGSEITSAQILGSRATSPDKLLEQRAASYVRLGRIEEAVDIYLELVYRNPRNANLYFRVSALLPGQENAEVLLQIVEDLIAKQPKNKRLSAEKGRLLYVLERKDEAMQHWRDLVSSSSQEQFNYTTVSNAMLQAGASDEAISLLEEGRVKLKDPKRFAFELARIHAIKHHYSAASREYLVHLDNSPGMLDHVANQLIKMLENPGAFEAIQAEFVKMLATPGEHPSVVLAQAKLLLHEKRYMECASTVLASDVSRELRHVLAIADELAGEKAWEPAGQLYLYVTTRSKRDKEIGTALLKLADTYDKRLQVKQEYESLGGYFKGNTFLEPDIRLIGSKGESLSKALTLYDSLQTLLPRTEEAFSASFNIAELHLTVSGDVDRALRGYKHIFDRSNRRDDKLRAGLRMVDTWLVRGDTTNALKALEQVAIRARLDEDQADYVQAMIKIFMFQGDLARLNKALLNLSGAASPMDPLFNDGLELTALLDGNGGAENDALKDYLAAEGMVTQHKLSEAIARLMEIDETSLIGDEAQVRAIELMLMLGRHDEAAGVMDAFIRNQVDSEWLPTVLTWRGEHAQYFMKEPMSAISYYEEVVVNHPSYINVHKVRVRLREILGAGS